MKKIMCVLISVILAFLVSACGCVNNAPVAPTDAAKVTKKTVNIYFPDENVMYFKAEERVIEGADDIDYAEAIIKEILKGPVSEKLNPAIRGDVKVLSIAIDENGLCTLDLSKEFETYNTGGSAMESMAIYSVVNSLCELDSIEKVKINIDGEENAEYGGHFLLDEPFEPDKNLINTDTLD